MLAVAWLVSVLFSIPQIVVYNANNDKDFCMPDFQVQWGTKVRLGFTFRERAVRLLAEGGTLKNRLPAPHNSSF